jgi:hypothetical protein
VDSIKLEFAVSECNGWPTLQFLIDDDLYHDYQFSQEHEVVELPIDLLNGTHQLDINIYGKTPKNTIVDTDGNILKDQLVELLDIYVNDIKLPHYFKFDSVYKFNDQEYKQALVFGCNGNWLWNFETPILNWVLDYKNNHQAQYNIISNEDLVVSHVFNQAKIDKTIEILEILEQEITKLDDV